MRMPKGECETSKEMFAELAKTWVDLSAHDKSFVEVAYVIAGNLIDMAASQVGEGIKCESLILIRMMVAAAMLKVIEDAEQLVEMN